MSFGLWTTKIEENSLVWGFLWMEYSEMFFWTHQMEFISKCQTNHTLLSCTIYKIYSSIDPLWYRKCHWITARMERTIQKLSFLHFNIFSCFAHDVYLFCFMGCQEEERLKIRDFVCRLVNSNGKDWLNSSNKRTQVKKNSCFLWSKIVGRRFSFNSFSNGAEENWNFSVFSHRGLFFSLFFQCDMGLVSVTRVISSIICSLILNNN